MKRVFFGFATAALITGSASAATFITDTFSYPDGDLVPNGGWVNQSGSAGTLDVVGGEVLVTQDSGSEDAELQFANNLATGVVTATFDIRVEDTGGSGITGTDYEYFAHFSNDSEFNFRARMDVVDPIGGGDFSLGLSTSSSVAEAKINAPFTFGTTYQVVLSYDLDAGLASLTANGQTISSTTVSLGDTLDSFNLRQSNSSSDETIYVDNLVVDYVPEPGSLAVLGLGGFLLARRRMS